MIMKKYNNRRLLTFTLFTMIFLFFVTTVSAKEVEPLSINFTEFQFVTYDYNPDEVRVEYKKDGINEIANIINADGEILETMSVKSEIDSLKKDVNICSPNPLRLQDVHPYVFTRSVSYGGTSVEFNMNVELYSKGSFRSINSYQGGYVGIGTSVTTTRLEGSNHNAWSPNDFPTVELYYAFNGTIVAEVYSSTSWRVKADLIAAGFSSGGSLGQTTYYRRAFNSSGIVKLYN